MRAIFVFLFLTSVIAVYDFHPPLSVILPNIHRCTRYQKKIEKCVRRSIISLKPYLITGVPYLSIPHFNPYRKISYQFTTNAEFNGSTTFTNVTLYGLTNYRIRRVRVSFDAYEIRFLARFPLIKLYAYYNVTGSISGITGREGPFKINGLFANITAHVTLSGEYYEHDSLDEYFRITDVTVTLMYGSAEIVRCKNREFSHDIRSFLDKHWESLGNDIHEMLESTAADVIKEIANKIYSNFPMKMLLPY